MNDLPAFSEFISGWPLDRATVFLNHGSFGATPRFILQKQQEYRERLESQPVRFMMREVEELVDRSRRIAAGFVGADPADLVFVQNATAGVNAVFRSLQFNPGDEIIYHSHIYGACKQVLEFVAKRTGAILVEASYNFPVDSPGTITEAILSRVTLRTRIVLVDHISSATALVHPVEEVVRELTARGIDTMIDGAHAPGSIPLDLGKLGAAYYTGNCHKWLCAPKSAAILHVRRDRQRDIFPVVISHAGAFAEPFAERFYWPGTHDPTPAICVGDAIGYLGGLLPGGWTELMQRNHRLCLEAREMICNSLGISKPCPDQMIASMATFPLPVSSRPASIGYKGIEPLQELLYTRYSIEVPVWNWNSPPSRLIRIAVQLYNSMEQYRYFAEALNACLAEGG
jgi:isopenicillin-N epimerase